MTPPSRSSTFVNFIASLPAWSFPAQGNADPQLHFSAYRADDLGGKHRRYCREAQYREGQGTRVRFQVSCRLLAPFAIRSIRKNGMQRNASG